MKYGTGKIKYGKRGNKNEKDNFYYFLRSVEGASIQVRPVGKHIKVVKWGVKKIWEFPKSF